jgi:hypothetical protein
MSTLPLKSIIYVKLPMESTELLLLNLSQALEALGLPSILARIPLNQAMTKFSSTTITQDREMGPVDLCRPRNLFTL